MPRRSAPFVIPDYLNPSDSTDGTIADSTTAKQAGILSDLPAEAQPLTQPATQPVTPAVKQQAKQLLSVLQADIAEFRHQYFPPDALTQVRDMPIYRGNLKQTHAYHEQWQGLIDRALAFYPSAYLPPDYLPLPASLEIPQFIYHVRKLHLTKTHAKESKSFGSVGALLDKCGSYSDAEQTAMQQVFEQDETARLVAHRSFIDLRAYVFCNDKHGRHLDPQRIRFYRTGLIIHTLADFHIVDNRQKPRKRRNDAYSNPIADNDVWKVYIKR